MTAVLAPDSAGLLLCARLLTRQSKALRLKELHDALAFSKIDDVALHMCAQLTGSCRLQQWQQTRPKSIQAAVLKHN